MQLGFATAMAGGNLSFAEVVQWAAAKGFDCVEVMGQHLHEVLDSPPQQTLHLTRRHGVDIAALAPMLNLLDADATVRGERINFLQRTMDRAEALGVRVVVTYGGSAFGMYFYGMPGVSRGHRSPPLEENLQLFADVYGPLADYAAQRGVRIAFETAPRGGGHGNIAHCPELWDRMFELVPSPALGLSLDPSHLVWLFIPVEETIRAYGSRIYHVDGKDTEILPEILRKQGIWGNHWWRYRVPGMGQVNWGGVVSALKEVGYAGAIDIENEDPLFSGLLGIEMAGRHLRQFVPAVHR
ncbi:MAG: sugar phosphate isomerase/epimerase [Abditibacteriales bacterium]|nr:sugar phosphate isomerase/epimerase [Abditibacteriales bacterium]MDW8367563.1 sugar phosphate isomerase/epimerase [Abditibacteriales bacterium]